MCVTILKSGIFFRSAMAQAVKLLDINSVWRWIVPTYKGRGKGEGYGGPGSNQGGARRRTLVRRPNRIGRNMLLNTAPGSQAAGNALAFAVQRGRHERSRGLTPRLRKRAISRSGLSWHDS